MLLDALDLPIRKCLCVAHFELTRLFLMAKLKDHIYSQIQEHPDSLKLDIKKWCNLLGISNFYLFYEMWHILQFI